MADVPVSMEFDSAWLAPSGVLDDRYEIQRLLGRGGAAIVLLARDRRYERDVAGLASFQTRVNWRRVSA